MKVEIAAVKGALQWVLYTNQIILTDVFRYGNVYVQTDATAGMSPIVLESVWKTLQNRNAVGGYDSSVCQQFRSYMYVNVYDLARPPLMVAGREGA